MAVPIRKNLAFFIFKHASSKNFQLCISPVSLSLSPHFFSTDTNPTVYDILVHKHDFPCEFASWIASMSSRVKNPEIADSMLSFLKSNGFSNPQLQKILKFRPNFLCHKHIKSKIKGFQEEGFSSKDISKMISCCPTILYLSLENNIIPSLSVLRDLLGSNAAAVRGVRNSPRLLQLNLERTMVANVEFLKRCGVSLDRIRLALNGGSLRAFCCKPQVIRASVEKAKEMGLSVSSKAFIYGIQTIGSTSNVCWELKLQAFRDTGFSESDILSMFRREPRVFGVSIEKMKKITEGLVATGKFDISSIVHHPTSLMFSFEKRYKPRIRVLRILESRNLIEDWPPLRMISHASEAKFSEVFVRPYRNEVGDVYMEGSKINQ